MMNKKNDKAVAVKYNAVTDHAPKVTAKGEGLIAHNIKKIAEERGIPLYRDDTLVELLSEVDLDKDIPPELYMTIAEILSWIYRADKDLRIGAHRDEK